MSDLMEKLMRCESTADGFAVVSDLKVRELKALADEAHIFVLIKNKEGYQESIVASLVTNRLAHKALRAAEVK